MFTTRICDIVRSTTCVERPAPIAMRVRRSNLDQLLDQRFSNYQRFALAVQCNTRPITITETVKYDMSSVPPGATCHIQTFLVNGLPHMNLNVTQFEDPCVDPHTSNTANCVSLATVRC